ncbi:Aldo/keto reductase [Leucosporidium creatinivorum]|uniref:Aldo/keto reductase n=1 Tax=Leucosporidium creatinivorum TaxID=106004 RepID=A0A1Y2E5I2_9BASI|nr:Aldo/keto reductase [Leucosporidium creatinivorum]
MATIKLASSLQPLVGFGLWKVPNADAADTVYNALKAGYRLLDAAADYGNEKECGQGLARAIKDGVVTREEVFLVSKLWNTNHAYEHVKPACEKSLKDWGVDYFDLYLIHFPVSLAYVDPKERYPPAWWDATGPGGKVTLSKDPMSATWKAMEELREAGLAKSIGISNCSGSLIVDLLRSAKHKPEVLQIEHHPYLTQEPLIKFAKEIGLAITAYSSFGPQSFLELEHAGALDTPSLLEHPTIKAIADAHSKSPAQVLLRWSTQRGIAVIPKSNNPERAKQNLEHVNFDLTEDEIKQISALNKNLRFNNPADIHPELAIFA